MGTHVRWLVVPADYNGDGLTDVSIKGSDGSWCIAYTVMNPDTGSGQFTGWGWCGSGYGDSTAHAVPADYDGDGKADLAVYTDAGAWLIDLAANSFGQWDIQKTGYICPGFLFNYNSKSVPTI